ncbi:MAG: hypothetical protein IIC67_05600 [Thaumarchaeota archaeon]|nr:hypothetical protein [Nitrososphaerota archaeon]
MVQITPGTFCPILRKKCIEFECKFWDHLRGLHPQTGQEIDEYECSIKLLPMLLIENAQQSRQTGAAVESFRNEMVDQNKLLLEQTKQNDNIKQLTKLEKSDGDL